MLSFLTQFVMLVLAGFALFYLWRANRSSDRLIDIMITGGFLARALVGQLLFWISYAELGIGRRFQMGDGLWFFARDALQYFPTATHLANTGVRAIINYPTGGASAAFVKVLATSVLLLGGVTSVAVLLNLFCYLGMTAVIVRWSEGEPRARLAAAFAICAITLSPAFFLWSLQPLKDTFFQFLVIAFIGACAAWQRAWVTSRPRPTMLLIIGGAMMLALLAISGVRWYFAFGLFIAATVFLLITASISRGRKAVAFAATVIVIVLLSRAFLLGGGPYVPTSIIRVMTPSTAFGEARRLPSQIFLQIEMARDAFEKAGGRTSIHAGGSISKLDKALDTPRAGNEPKTAAGSASSLPRKEETAATATAAAGSAPSLPRKEETAATATAPPRAVRAVPQRATVERPPSFMTDVLTGVASILIPRSVGERLGLFHIGGGQGMFWFTELDTIIFDLIFLVAVSALAVRRSVSLRNPLVWFLVLLTLLLGIPLAYAITNYGTLFRLREMIYIGLALTPLAQATASRRLDAGDVSDVSPAS